MMGNKKKVCLTCKWRLRDGATGGVCALASSEVGVAVYPESKAIAYDGDTWSGWLSVSDDFGCVMWEERVEDGEEDQV